MHTAIGNTSTPAGAETLTGAPVLAKPFDADELVAVVAKLLEGNQTR